MITLLIDSSDINEKQAINWSSFISVSIYIIMRIIIYNKAGEKASCAIICVKRGCKVWDWMQCLPGKLFDGNVIGGCCTAEVVCVGGDAVVLILLLLLVACCNVDCFGATGDGAKIGGNTVELPAAVVVILLDANGMLPVPGNWTLPPLTGAGATGVLVGMATAATGRSF